MTSTWAQLQAAVAEQTKLDRAQLRGMKAIDAILKTTECELPSTFYVRMERDGSTVLRNGASSTPGHCSITIPPPVLRELMRWANKHLGDAKTEGEQP